MFAFHALGVLSIHSGEIPARALGWRRVAEGGDWHGVADCKPSGLQFPASERQLCRPLPLPSPLPPSPGCLQHTQPPWLALPVLLVGTRCAVSLPRFLTAGLWAGERGGPLRAASLGLVSGGPPRERCQPSHCWNARPSHRRIGALGNPVSTPNVWGANSALCASASRPLPGTPPLAPCACARARQIHARPPRMFLAPVVPSRIPKPGTEKRSGTLPPRSLPGPTAFLMRDGGADLVPYIGTGRCRNVPFSGFWFRGISCWPSSGFLGSANPSTPPSLPPYGIAKVYATWGQIL